MDRPLNLPNLMTTLRDPAFAPVREGVEIHTLWPGTPTLAILRYTPGARVPRHLHTRLETILVLDGVQCDEHGCYGTGSVVLHPKDRCIRSGPTPAARC